MHYALKVLYVLLDWFFEKFFGTHGDDFYKKLNSRSDLALILGVLKRYRSAEESDDPYTKHLWSQIDPIVVGKAKAI